MRKLQLFLFCICNSACLLAQNNYISVEEGLSHRHVTCVLQDHTGLIWVGTVNGLNVYDGYSFKNYFTFTKTIALSNAHINCLVEDGQGNLWVGTNSGLNKISPNRSSAQSINGLRDKSITSLLLLANNNILIGTSSGEILSSDSANKIKLLYRDEREISITGLLVDKQGTTWFYNDPERKSYSIDKSYKRVEKFSGLISSNLLLAGDTIVASFVNDKGIKIWNEFQDKFISNAFLDSLNRIYGAAKLLYQDKRKTLWAAYAGGILLNINLRQRHFTDYSHYFKRTYFGSSIINITEDQNGMMWVGTDGGLVKVTVASPLFTRYLYNSNAENLEAFINVRGIIEDRKGNICIATHKGLYVLNPKDNSLKHFLVNNNPAIVFYRFNLEQENNLLASTTIKEGLLSFNTETNKFSTVAVSHNKADEGLYALCRDSEGEVWVGTRKGLTKLDEKKNLLIPYVTESKNEAIASSIIYDIKEFPTGILWVATSKGLVRIEKATRKLKHYKVGSSPALSSDEIFSVTPDENHIWIATHGGGLMKLDLKSDSITYINTMDGLSSSIVYGIIRSGNNLWMSTGNGISRMDLTTGHFKNYHEKDGLTDNEFNSASYFKASDGRIYFGGINGLNAFYPDALVEEKTKDKIILTSVVRGNSELLTTLTSGIDQIITLPYSDRNLSVQFALTDFYRPQENRFYYQIKGIDNDWVNIGNQNFLRISQLPVGTHELLVKGKNLNDQESVNQIKLILNVEQVFYKTTWFILIFILSIFGLIYFFFRIRIEQLHRTQHLRTKIASDLHDEVGSMLTRISILTEVLKYKNKDQEEIIQIAIASRQATSTMSDVLWSVDARNDKIGNLVDRMREHADALLRPLNIAIHFESTLNDNNALDMQMRQSILLIFKEAVHNVVKHAQATTVWIELKVKDNTLIMIIRDNGKGISNTIGTKNSSGQGMKNMNMRAHDIGGKLHVENDNGYVVTLSKPLR